MKDIHILAVESSCDDTSAAVFRNDSILANLVAGQEVHRAYGGVVPELASRAHLQNIIPVVDAALKQAAIDKQQLDAIAFTRGPGLIGSLLVGVSFCKAMALALNIPLIEVNHMQAHVLAHFIEQPMPKFPFLCLTVSGGHTQIVLVRDYLDMEVVGKTLDDAAGEAFDKTAKILGLPYPGGPLVDKYAQQGSPKFKFAEQAIQGLDFSFSGFKTSVLYSLQKWQKDDPNFIENNLYDLCASIQHNICEALIRKLARAAREYHIKEIAIAGGVSANTGLRSALAEAGEKHGWNIYIPKFEYCTDNAGMIGITAYYKYLKGAFTDQSVTPLARYGF
ncbi:MAG: tRNA (adenosine(37)-N6)-threonylcarbamoyltransferase complex transferase subunit TsaD [Chitinophagales bacterium]|nr:tRNA (adenosine(37)-N6)-threonylcarbamoyltransferase complex transferase subunit TsaD [Chitinophagales bacterium]